MTGADRAPTGGGWIDLSSGPVQAAKSLLGSLLISELGPRVSLTINETEAYGGSDDPASHAFRRPTARNGSMFGPAGFWYVYRSYGVHWCLNLVTGPAGEGQAVLLRGGQTAEGEEVAARRRGRSDHLADGPGKLTQVLGATGAQDGSPAFAGPLRLEPGPPPDPSRIRATPRIGITKATDRPWRFLLET